VDNTTDAEEAVEWAVQYLLRPGDELHLVHVVSDPRTNEVQVGAWGGGGAASAPAMVDYEDRQSHFHRLQQQAETMIAQRFAPQLRDAGSSFKVDILRERGMNSAAGIGHALCEHAAQLGSSIMLIASHGSGVLADYGSVAKYCSANSSCPVLLIPPHVQGLQNQEPGVLLVVALADTRGLQHVTEFALKNFWRQSESVHAIYIEDRSSSGEPAPSQQLLCQQVEQTIAQVAASSTGSTTVECQLEVLAPPTPLDSTGDFDMGEEICDRADQLQARTVVLLHHGKDLVKEMVFGSITSYATRNCKRPLVVYYQ
jgi:structural maintenance of chromosome 2